MGYCFQDQELLIRALTHSSHVHESHRVPVDPGDLAQLSNEQFEFLGDAILGFVISEELVRRFPQYGEGKLSRLKAHLVSASHLHEAAQKLELGRFLRLGRGEELSGGRRQAHTDYRRAGGGNRGCHIWTVACRLPCALILEYVTEKWRPRTDREPVRGFSQLDYKTAFQELVRARKMAQPPLCDRPRTGARAFKSFHD